MYNKFAIRIMVESYSYTSRMLDFVKIFRVLCFRFFEME